METFIHAYSWVDIRFLLQGLWVTIYVSLISIVLSFVVGLIQLGIVTNPTTASITALVIFEGAMLAEIVRSGIGSVDPGQMEGARSNGMSYGQAMYHVIMPQALHNMIPALLSQFVSLVKDTSLATIIVLPELLYHAQIIYSQNTTYLIPIYVIIAVMYVIIAVMYFIVCFCLSQVANYLQKKYNN